MIYVPSLCFKEQIFLGGETFISLFPPGTTLSLVSEYDFRRWKLSCLERSAVFKWGVEKEVEARWHTKNIDSGARLLLF